MLTGYYTTPEGHKLHLQGYDFDTYFTFVATPTNGAAKRFFDRGVVLDEMVGPEYFPWTSLYFRVGSSDIKLEDLALSKVRTDFNLEAFSRLGSILRGMKNTCLPQREKDYNALTTTYKSVFEYTYFDHKVALTEGALTYLEYKNGEEELFLEETPSEPVPMASSTTSFRKIALVLNEFQRTDDLGTGGMEDFFDTSVGTEEVYSLSEIIARNPEKSYTWLKGRCYHIVSDLEVWKKIAVKIYSQKGIVAFDTETTGLDITFRSASGNGDKLVGLVFSINRSEEDKKRVQELLDQGVAPSDFPVDLADAWYVPIAHKNIENVVPEDRVAWFIETLVKPILEQKDILCHNGAFDVKVMFIYNVHVNLKHDTMILLRLSYGAEDTTMRLGLKPNALRFLSRDSFELSDFVRGSWGEGSITFADLPYESVKYYACPDTDSTLALHNLGQKENWYDRWGMRRVYELEVAFSIVLAYQEFFGHKVDVSRITSLGVHLREDANKYSQLIFDLAGYELNLRSGKDLRKLFFETLKMPVLDKTDSGAPSTSKKVLKKYKGYKNDDGSPKYPVADYLLKYRDAAKLLSDFVDKLDTFATKDGYIFSSVRQFLETGRLSVSNSNYQSYSDTVKKYIVPRKGFYMMDSDYSSVEIRIMMSMAKEKPMIEYLFDPDSDYHTLKASQMFSIPYEQVSSSQRGAAKGVNFGIVYGMGDASLGENVTGKRTAESTRYGGQLRKLYFKGMDVTESFIANNLEKAVENRYAETFFGRRRYFPPTMSLGSVKRQGGNHPIQGTAADLYKQAMVNLYANIRKRGWWSKFLLPCFVHDEIVMEAHETINPAVAMTVVRESLMLAIEGWCPLYIGFGYGSHWYNAKKTEVPVQLQDQWLEEYKDGFPFWDGNIHNLYAWEVSQIYGYKANRIKSYLEDERNHGQVISPVISGFLYDVMGYVEKLGKLYNLLENQPTPTLEDLVPYYRSLESTGIYLEQFTSPYSLLVDQYELRPTSLSSDERERLYSSILELPEQIRSSTFLEGLKSTTGQIKGISDTLLFFGTAFGLEDLVKVANVQEPKEVESSSTPETVAYEPELKEWDDEEAKEEYLKSFGYYRDYNTNLLYLSATNSVFLNYVLNYLQKVGAVSRKADQSLFTTLESHYQASEGTKIEVRGQQYSKVVFDLGNGQVHKNFMFLPTKLVPRVVALASQTWAKVEKS